MRTCYSIYNGGDFLNMDETHTKFERLTGDPVSKLILRLAVPTVLSMLISTLYNMADAFFVGQINASASGAISVIFSYMAIIQAFGYFFGHGSGNYVSLKLGEQNREEAEKMAATGFFSSLAFGFFIMVLGLIFTDPLITMLGSTETIRPYAREYLIWILLGTPYMTASLTLNNQLRFQGSALYAMIALVSGGVINIGLDAVFVTVLGMGTGGAGLATAISQLCSFCLLLSGTFFGGNLRLKLKNFQFKKFYFKVIAGGGLPSLGRQSVSGIATVCVNFVCKDVLGANADAMIGALGNVTKITGFCNSIILGFGQGFQPVCGFNYGAKNYKRVLRGFYFTLCCTTAFAAVVTAFGIVFAKPVTAAFTVDDKVAEYSAAAFRAQCAFFALSPWITVSSMLLQNIGKVVRATTLAVTRQGVAFIPAVFVAGYIIGANGLVAAQAVADLITFIIAVPITVPVLKLLRKSENEVF